MNLKTQNNSLLMKWLWSFASQEQSLWKEIIRTRYGMENWWITKATTQPYDTGLWRSIRNLWPKLINNCKIKVGDGRKTLFWEESWVGQGTLKDSFPDLLLLSLQEKVTVKEMRDHHGWNFRFRKPLNGWEMNKMAEFLNTQEQCKNFNTNEDQLDWIPDKQDSQ